MDDLFVGRQTELAFVRARLDEAYHGRSRIVVIEGPAGIGKSALLDAALRNVDRQRVLRASGDEIESGLRYGIVEQLLAGIGWDLPERLAALQSGSLLADPVRVGAGLVDLLSRGPTGGPLTVVVDDVQWGDVASLQALAFALRRLRSTRILTLLSIRDDAGERLPESLQRLVAGEAGARLRLEGLSVRELGTLAAAMGVGRLSSRAAERLREHTGGNALHLRSLLEELPSDALHNTAHPLPAPRSFRMLVLGRLAACPPNVGRLVVAASVIGGRCLLELARRLAEIDDPLPALEQAIAARLLEERLTATERLLAFPHPLVRAAVYNDLGPARRAALHARAAQLVEGEPAVVRHRVAAARGADAALAARVAALAGRQAIAGEWLAAADNLLAAARLSATVIERERFAVQAVEYLMIGGSTSEAASFAERLRSFAQGPRREYVLGRLALVQGRLDEARTLLGSAWDQCTPATEPELAVAIAEQLALLELAHLSGAAATNWARRALEAVPASAASRSNLLDLLMLGLAVSGNAPHALAASVPGRVTAARPAAEGFAGLVGRGILELWTDDLANARVDLETAASAYQCRGGPLPFGLIALAFLAEAEYRLGTWDDAIAHAELAVSIADDTAQDWIIELVRAIAAFTLAGRGVNASAEAHIRAARNHIAVDRIESSAAYVATAEAMMAAAAEDYERVEAALEPLVRIADRTGFNEPGQLPWRELYVESLLHRGAQEAAEAALEPLEALAAAHGRRSALAGASRARGNLEAARGRPERAEAAFKAGLGHLAPLPMPYNRALLEVAYGRFLRRASRRADAVVQLEAARARCVRVGARPLLERCDRELAACGRKIARRQAGPTTTLTPQELAVVRLVATGLTNRQAAAKLVVSIKTVEFHLGNAYAKLGVGSRTQLAVRLHQDDQASRESTHAAPTALRMGSPDAASDFSMTVNDGRTV